MSRALLMAEKPSLMRDILNVYKTMKMEDAIDFVAFAGHTMTLAEPKDYKEEWGNKKWNWDMLPIVPNEFKCKVSSDKIKMYNELKNKIKTGNYDYLINACDPDREGQTIFQYFVDHIGCKLPVKRFWTNDLTEKSIEKALLNLRDNNEPFLSNLTKASKLRGQFDWLIGMNLTVASSLKMNTTAKVGRVKTPTLKIIVDRELEIMNFKPTTTYELEGDFGVYKGSYIDEEGIVRFNKKEDAKEIIKKLCKESVIESIEKKNELSYAPQLYSLNSLQTDASKLYGYNADKTLSLVQSLYEKKILSYPRTDNPYISSELAKKFPNMIKVVAEIDDLRGYVDEILKDTKTQEDIAKNKRYVNDEKMAESGHYAIVPTGNKPQLDKLTKEELDIFTLVSKRFLSIFMPPIKTSKTTIITNNNGYLFKTTGKILIDKGYSVIYDTKTTDIELPNVNKGDKLELKGTNINEKISTPPQRYTDGTLISVMENPVKFLLDEGLKTTIKENKGIGTTATRANIITELVSNGYIEKKKNKGKVEYIYATPKGIAVIENLKDIDISSVDLTGIWEENLSKIEKGEMNTKEFTDLMVKYVLKSIEDIKISTMSTVSKTTTNIEPLGKCPKCGEIVKEGKDYYLCDSYKKSCDFIVGKKLLGANITKTDIKKLLTGKETSEKTFTKNDKTWKAKLIIEDNKVTFASNSKKNNKSQSNNKCPKCKKNLNASDKYFVCSDYKNGCDFIFSKTFMGATINDEDFSKLERGETIKKVFTWKSGKSGEAGLKLINGKPEFVFDK